MSTTTIEKLKGLANKGFKLHYGNHPDKKHALLRLLCEYRRIEVAGYAGYYLMAYWIFKLTADSFPINVWLRGAAPSSMVCYSLGLTDIDPIRYGLYSARFVNEQPPRFQFDIEEARFEEFKAKAVEIMKANHNLLFENGRKYLLSDMQPSSYLNKRRESPLPIPDNLDNEFAEYALSFPDTMNLYDTYKERKNGATWTLTGIAKLDEILAPTYGLLAYQEQMFDIMKNIFGVYGIMANNIRLSIQRGKTGHIEEYKNEVLQMIKDNEINADEFETIWGVLTSNPKAFLKAHAVSRVISRCYYVQ